MTIVSTDLTAAWADWHAERERSLAVPHGWLSLTGFHWLPGRPTLLPGLTGRWSADGDRAVLTATSADRLRVLADPDVPTLVGTVTAQVAEAGSLHWIGAADAVVELIRRGGRYALRVRDPQAVTRSGFTGVPAFPVDPAWVVPGRFEPFPVPQVTEVRTARPDLTQRVVLAGTLTVVIDGIEHPLAAGRSADGSLTLAFHDATNTVTTAPWRSLSIPAPEPDGSVWVDFNRTTNLPFSFTRYGTCPAPVRANVLPLAVTAGEQAPR